MKRQTSPPKWPVHILSRLCSEEQLEILYGDVYEVFHKRVRQEGRLKARLLFYRDAFSLIRPFALKRSEKIYPALSFVHMLNIYLKTGFRNLSKNRLTSFINLFGLTLGLVAVLLISQYAAFELSYDKFHREWDKVYRVSFSRTVNDEVFFNGATVFRPVGPALKENFPEVESQMRFYFPFTHAELRVEDRSFNEEKPIFADPTFFDVFSYPLIAGNQETALAEPNKVLLSRRLAERYFGAKEPLGKVLQFSFESGKTNLEVSGVLENPRADSHLKLDMLVSFSTIDQWDGFDGTDWQLPFYHTYIKFGQKPNVVDFESRGSALVESFRPPNLGNNISDKIKLQPLSDIHLDSDLTFELFENGDRKSVNLLIVIASLILTIAYLNYINLATARSVKRAKEVGVRKILGSEKRQLVYQFLTESSILNFIALTVAVLILIPLTPFFSDLIAKDFRMSTDPVFWMIIVGVTFLGSILSGIYPALILSGYKPIYVLKGNFISSRRGGLLRKALVSFQFVIAVTMIGGTMLLLKQTDFLLNQDLGFDASQTMVMNAPRNAENEQDYLSSIRTFSAEINSLPAINGFTHSGSVPGKVLSSGQFQSKSNGNGETVAIPVNTIGLGYFKTYGLEFLVGRGFSEKVSTDMDGVVLNEAALDVLGFQNVEEALNQKIVTRERELNVLGVVKNYHHSSLKESYKPLVFVYAPMRTLYFSFNLATDDLVSSLDKLESLVTEHFPSTPFEYTFLDQTFDAEFRSELRFAKLFKAFSLLSILLSGLGLFGLTAFMVNQKAKEISVRKVLGAQGLHILKLLTSAFMSPLIFGSLAAWGIIYYVGNEWLNGYAFRTELSWTFFVVPVGVVAILSAFTIGNQTLKALRSEPTKALRNE